MKKILISLALVACASTAFAQHRYHGYHGHHRHWNPHYGWVVPALIGGSVVYMATRPDPVVVQQPPVVYQQPPVVYQQTPPTGPNTVVIDGIAYTKQVMVINGVQQEVLVKQ